MAGAGRREIKQFLGWLQQQQSMQVKYDAKRAKDGSHTARLLLGGVPLAVGRGQSSSEAQNRAVATARNALYKKPQDLKAYIASHKRGEVQVPGAVDPPATKSLSTKSPILQMVAQERRQKQPSKKKAITSPEKSPSVSEAAAASPPANPPTETSPISGRRLDSIESRLKALENPRDTSGSSVTSADDRLKALESALRDLQEGSRKLKDSLELCIGSVAELKGDLASKATTIAGLDSEFQPRFLELFQAHASVVERQHEFDAKLAANQVSLEYLLEEIGRIESPNPDEVGDTASSTVASDKQFDQGGGNAASPSGPARFEDAIYSGLDEFAGSLAYELGEWCSAPGVSVEAALACLLESKLCLLPELGWLPALKNALTAVCTCSLIPVEAWWVSFDDAWRAGLSRCWQRAESDPGRLELCVLQNIDRALIQLWGMPLLNIVGGFTDELPLHGNPVWPPNLKILCTLAVDDAVLPFDSEALEAFYAIAPHREADTVEHATGPASATLSGSWAKAMRQDISRILQTAAKLQHPGTDLVNVAYSIRVNWPQTYSRRSAR